MKIKVKPKVIAAIILIEVFMSIKIRDESIASFWINEVKSPNDYSIYFSDTANSTTLHSIQKWLKMIDLDWIRDAEIINIFFEFYPNLNLFRTSG